MSHQVKTLTHSQIKKLKKKLLLAKNKHNQMIFRSIAQMHANAQGVEALYDAMEEKAHELEQEKNKEEKVAWSAKMQKVRNRLTGKKRMAKDRWNRFAGTASAGAMGL